MAKQQDDELQQLLESNLSQHPFIKTWSKGIPQPGIPPEVRQEFITLANGIKNGTETRSTEELHNHFQKYFQRALDRDMDKLMSSIPEGTPPVALTYVTNNVNIALKGKDDTRFSGNAPSVAKAYLSERGIDSQKSEELVKRLLEQSPVMLDSLFTNYSSSPLSGQVHLMYSKPQVFGRESLQDLNKRNQHALDANQWIRGAVEELKTKSVDQWFQDHAGELQQHETTLLKDMQRDMQRQDKLHNQVENLQRVSIRLEKLGIDQTEERKVITEKTQLHEQEKQQQKTNEPMKSEPRKSVQETQPVQIKSEKSSFWGNLKKVVSGTFKIREETQTTTMAKQEDVQTQSLPIQSRKSEPLTQTTPETVKNSPDPQTIEEAKQITQSSWVSGAKPSTLQGNMLNNKPKTNEKVPSQQDTNITWIKGVKPVQQDTTISNQKPWISGAKPTQQGPGKGGGGMQL